MRPLECDQHQAQQVMAILGIGPDRSRPFGEGQGIVVAALLIMNGAKKIERFRIVGVARQYRMESRCRVVETAGLEGLQRLAQLVGKRHARGTAHRHKARIDSAAIPT